MVVARWVGEGEQYYSSPWGLQVFYRIQHSSWPQKFITMHPGHYKYVPDTTTATKVKPLFLLRIKFGLDDIVVELTGFRVSTDLFAV
jgi:hypothetical protein